MLVAVAREKFRKGSRCHLPNLINPLSVRNDHLPKKNAEGFRYQPDMGSSVLVWGEWNQASSDILISLSTSNLLSKNHCTVKLSTILSDSSLLSQIRHHPVSRMLSNKLLKMFLLSFRWFCRSTSDLGLLYLCHLKRRFYRSTLE